MDTNGETTVLRAGACPKKSQDGERGWIPGHTGQGDERDKEMRERDASSVCLQVSADMS